MSDDIPRYDSLGEEDAARRARQKKTSDNGRNLLVGAGVVVGIIVLATLFSGDSSFSGDVTAFQPIDEANLQVAFAITNDGDDPAKGECTIEAHDASGVVGWDVLSSVEDIEAGETVNFSEAIRIEDEGAFRVREVIAKNCGEA